MQGRRVAMTGAVTSPLDSWKRGEQMEKEHLVFRISGKGVNPSFIAAVVQLMQR